MLINEEFIQYLWKFRLFHPELRTESGESVSVLHPGEQNTGAGPDFFNARIRIGNTTWAGNVEIHVKASDWFRHSHHVDPAYSNTILHVVYDSDREAVTVQNRILPTVMVQGQFSLSLLETYKEIMQAREWIPCTPHLCGLPENLFSLWSPVLAMERIEQKTNAIRLLLETCNGNWEETFYRYLAVCFGFKVNALPFELLAKSLPLKYIRKNCDNLFRLEALLFGQAGMLDCCFIDDYPGKLAEEYAFLRTKYTLLPISPATWKFLRLRPANFPTLRISQFARFLYITRGSLLKILEINTPEEIYKVFNIRASAYWDTRFLFDRPTAVRPKLMGRASIQLLVINAWVIFKFFYGLEKNLSSICEQAFHMLEELKVEHNAVLDGWSNNGLKAENALQSQALIHLKTTYCDRKRCLECRIGERIIKENC